MELIMILSGVICIACVFAGSLSSRIGVPSLLLFILLGMVFGTDGIFKIPFSNFQLSETICSFALVFIMFYGGFCTNWEAARPSAVKSVLLSTIGVGLTAAFTGFFCHFVLKTSLLEGFLIGSVIGSTDAASVFSILRTKKLNLKGGIASILEMESGSNDPTAYMLTIVILGLMRGASSSAEILITLFTQLFFGLILGAAAGYCGIRLLNLHLLRDKEMLPILAMALAVLTFGLSSFLNGNGFLSVYVAGILLGNGRINGKIGLVRFFDSITAMMHIILFFLLGLLSFPSRIPDVFLPSLAIMFFLLFIARPVAVGIILTPFSVPFRQQALISWAGLRGAASIVFAIVTVLSPAELQYDIFHIVFCICLMSAALQGSLLPWAAKKLDVIGSTDNIFKTFNDYEEDASIHLTEIRLPDGHPWIGQQVKEISFPNGMLAVMVLRAGSPIIPRGDTRIQPEDTIILNGCAYHDETGIKLQEVEIGPYHPWVNRQIKALNLPEIPLIILIRRDGQSFAPDGQTFIRDGDLLILHAQPAV